MRAFRRLFGYTRPYRSRFLAGVVVAFFVALFNGLSIAVLYPLFEALNYDQDVFLLPLSGTERNILRQTATKQLERMNPIEREQFIRRYELPVARLTEILSDEDRSTRFSPEVAVKLLEFTRDPVGIRDYERFAVQTVIKWKLKINAGRANPEGGPRIGYSPFEVIVAACLAVIPLYFMKLLLLLVCVRLIARTGYRAVRDLREELYDRMQRLPLSHFYRERSGELVSRLINDVETVAAVLASNMRDAITNIFLLVTCLGLMAYFNWQLLLLCIVAVPIMLSPVTMFTRKIRKSITRSQQLLAGLNGYLQEAVSGVRVIRAAAMEDYETERFRHVNNRFYWRSFKQIFYLKMSPLLVELNSSVIVLGVIGLAAQYLDDRDFTSGEFLIFFITLLFAIRPIIQLSGMYAKIQAAEAAGERIFSILDADPEAVDPPTALPLRRLEKSIQFDNVCFTYPSTDRQVLTDICLDVPVGSTVALVGESGGGKSTLMDLMARFFLPTGGRILLDGQDIRDFRVADHRSRIGIVTQDIFLFYGSIFQNIAYGSPDHDRRAVERAARLAHAHDFIREFYEGYETLVGNRGMNLSGGQRQRIAIARALLRDPEILILDEATSALDTESERLVQIALDRLLRNRTTFVIAHRLSTVEKADMIVVISGGRIVDSGSHADLMERGGLYQRLQQISRQIEDFTIEGTTGRQAG